MQGADHGSYTARVDAAAAQALGQFVGDGIAVLAIGGVIWQLSMQRQELKAQREQSAAADEDRRQEAEDRRQEAESRRKRDELLETQLADMRAEREAARRKQANRVAVRPITPATKPAGVELDERDSLHGVQVANESDRPIRQVRGGIRLRVVP